MIKLGFGSLSNELNTQISFKSMDGDVSACHLKANPTINSVAEVNNVSIQRVSLKKRNSLNKLSKGKSSLLS